MHCTPYVEEQVMEPYYSYEEPQGEKTRTPSYYEPPISLDIGTLMYMARNLMEHQRNQPNKNTMGCNGCGADNQWLKYCLRVENKFKPP